MFASNSLCLEQMLVKKFEKIRITMYSSGKISYFSKIRFFGSKYYFEKKLISALLHICTPSGFLTLSVLTGRPEVRERSGPGPPADPDGCGGSEQPAQPPRRLGGKDTNE